MLMAPKHAPGLMTAISITTTRPEQKRIIGIGREIRPPIADGHSSLHRSCPVGEAITPEGRQNFDQVSCAISTTRRKDTGAGAERVAGRS